jgi:hypothetical protein
VFALQIDNQTEQLPQFDVLLFSRNQRDQSLNTPCMSVKLERCVDDINGTLAVKSFALTHKDICVRLDEMVLLLLIQFFKTKEEPHEVTDNRGAHANSIDLKHDFLESLSHGDDSFKPRAIQSSTYFEV